MSVMITPAPGRRLTAAAAAAAAVACAAALFTATPAAAATTSGSLQTLAANLPVATEVRTGYDRALFPHWIDTDGDSCNTRYEVLIAEAVTAPTIGSGCSLTGGRWYSYYDNAYWTLASDLDVDHVVALAEAWDSGARTWTTSRRQSFANDLGDARSLVAVTDNVNQSKSDRDPAEWLPPHAGARCRFLTDWVATKTRWRLTVDGTERSALVGEAASCPTTTITVTYAG